MGQTSIQCTFLPRLRRYLSSQLAITLLKSRCNELFRGRGCQGRHYSNVLQKVLR
jgi:hypothetical protein